MLVVSKIAERFTCVKVIEKRQELPCLLNLKYHLLLLRDYNFFFAIYWFAEDYFIVKQVHDNIL